MAFGRLLLLAGINGFIAVAAGAFGAHGLKARVGTDALAVFETGARYHLFHALALLGIAVLARHDPTRMLGCAAMCIQLGIVFFSGSLYFMGLTDMRLKWLGVVTPIGGVLFLTGWLLLGAAGFIATRSLPGGQNP